MAGPEFNVLCQLFNEEGRNHRGGYRFPLPPSREFSPRVRSRGDHSDPGIAKRFKFGKTIDLQ